MEDLASSSESLEWNISKTRRSNRPDLDDQDFQEFNLNKVDEFRKVFIGGELFNGREDEQITPDIVEEDKVHFGGGTTSYVFSSRIKGQWFALKRVWISIDDIRLSYNKEIKCLQALRKSISWHIVQLIGHYAEPANEGRLVLSPLAECTLEHYISHVPTLGRQQIVMRWFGCLAGALKTIHQQNIKHKDLKPENILVHGHNIIITDLGISNKFTERSTSLGASFGSFTYMAPEVHYQDRRGRQQDVWSMICCFIEMLSFISGYTVSEFRSSCTPIIYWFNFTKNYDEVIAWLSCLRAQTKDQTHLALIDLLRNGLKKEPKERPTAKYLFDSLRDMGTFIGECCALPQHRHAVEYKKFCLSLSTDPQLLKRGSLSHFLVHAGHRIIDRLNTPSVHASICELLKEVESEQIRSFRSAERKVLFFIAPGKCTSAKEYLSFCDYFIDELTKAICLGDYCAYFYDKQLGEAERPYSTAYFAILVEEVLSRCRTYLWVNNNQ